MTVTPKEFLEGLTKSRLLTDEDVAEIRNTLSAEELGSAQAIAHELVREGKLTSFQASRILNGKTRGLVLGNNVVVEKIGEGGMGEVFKAEHIRMKRPVVIKVLPDSATRSPQSVRRFQREVEAAAKLNHPNVVTAFDADEENGIHFLVMEFVDGKPLGDLTRRHGPLSVGKSVDCALQAARGLEYAHSRGVIHRDIKPNNLLQDKSGMVKILDMGLARIERGDDERSSLGELTQANQIVGTVEYMSPEQADDSSSVDNRSDIYSLGCTLFRLLTGTPPYSGSSAIKTLLAHRTEAIPSLKDACPHVTEKLNNVYEKMVAKSPEQRYQTMTDVVRALSECLEELEFDVQVSPLPGRKSDDLSVTRELEREGSTWGGSKTQVTDGDKTSELLMDRAEKGPAKKDPRSSSTLRTPPAPIRYPAIGIDLGTTFSAVAYLDDLGRPQTILNSEGDKTTPSVVLVDDGEVVVGKEAVKAMATEMELIAECAKRDLGFRTFHKSLGGRQFPPEVLQSLILNKLRTDIVRALGKHNRVVITVPAYFDEVRRKATQDAGFIAGLEVLDIINEPTAAAVAYGFQQGLLASEPGSGGPRRVLVYDLGGGTFDVTVMEIGGKDFVTLATDGDVRLGGRDWDQRLVDHVARQFQTEFDMDPREDPNTLGRLWRDCEDAKRTLSARSKTNIVCDYKGHAVKVAITRDEFETLTEDLLDRTSFTTRQTLMAAGLEWKEIDRVLLVGGSTRMPAVQLMLKSLSGLQPDCSVSPDEAVAHGAALHAGLLMAKHQGTPPLFSVTNVNSHSLGVAATDMKTMRKLNAVLIPRNTPLPASAKRVFTTQKQGQKSIRVDIVEGESESPDDCTAIGKCSVRDLPAELPALTPIEVGFHYEENGRLNVTVSVGGTGTRNMKQEITRENSLSSNELNRYRQQVSSGDHPQLDA